MYIGKSIHIEERFTEHKRDLNNNKHCNKHLQSAWNKYGKDNFIFSVLEQCEEEDLNSKEIFWIAENRDNSYNMTAGGDGGAMPEEIRQEISRKLKGRHLTEEHKKKISLNNARNTLGKHHSEETRKKMSDAKKGKPSNRKGKKLNEEQSIRMGLARRGMGKITKDTAEIIINMLLNGKKIREISDELNISRAIVSGIKYKANWSYLTEGLDFGVQKRCKNAS